MRKQTVLEIVTQSRLVAIVRLDDLSCAHKLTAALLAGGIRAIEFTLTNKDTPSVVSALLGEFPAFSSGQATIGIGSVRSVWEAQTAIDCGAQFLVSPITKPEVIRLAEAADVVSMPGAYTPTEIAMASELGADIVKVFPAKGLGPGYFKDILAPMPYLKLMPTGGVDLENMSSYFSAGAVAVGIGSQLVSNDSISRGEWGTIERLSLAYSTASKKVGAHKA